MYIKWLNGVQGACTGKKVQVWLLLLEAIFYKDLSIVLCLFLMIFLTELAKLPFGYHCELVCCKSGVQTSLN